VRDDVLLSTFAFSSLSLSFFLFLLFSDSIGEKLQFFFAYFLRKKEKEEDP